MPPPHTLCYDSYILPLPLNPVRCLWAHSCCPPALTQIHRLAPLAQVARLQRAAQEEAARRRAEAEAAAAAARAKEVPLG